jgi:four helix bundle protein
MKEGNIILDKSKAFALRVIRLYKYLCQEKKEFILSKQIVRSGTSIGANAKEAHAAQS